MATPFLLGKKIVMVNLSDLASKGARPGYALLALGLPPEAPIDAIKDFFRGLDEVLTEHGARLLGGDTFRAPQWTISLSLKGTLQEGIHISSRVLAREGMNLFVTGQLGESAAGLDILEGRLKTEDSEAERQLVKRHLLPYSTINLGEALAESLPDLAMMDVSDGLLEDAFRLAEASNRQVVLEEAAFPVSDALRKACKDSPEKITQYILNGGEDYELLFCTKSSPEIIQAVLSEHGHTAKVTRIGRITTGSGVVLQDRSGNRKRLSPGGFNHFPKE